jgi:hypothetical protein
MATFFIRSFSFVSFSGKNQSIARSLGTWFVEPHLRVLVRLLTCDLELAIDARLAHAACFSTVALREVIAAVQTIEFRAKHSVTVRVGLQRDGFLPTAGAPLADDSVALYAETGHPRRRIERAD